MQPSWSYQCHSFSISLQFESQPHVDLLVSQRQDHHLKYLLVQHHSAILSLEIAGDLADGHFAIEAVLGLSLLL